MLLTRSRVEKANSYHCRGAVQRRRARLLGGAAEQNAEPDHWSEQPTRFSVRGGAAVRMRVVRSTVPVGGCRSVLTLDQNHQIHTTMKTRIALTALTLLVLSAGQYRVHAI